MNIGTLSYAGIIRDKKVIQISSITHLCKLVGKTNVTVYLNTNALTKTAQEEIIKVIISRNVVNLYVSNPSQAAGTLLKLILKHSPELLL